MSAFFQTIILASTLKRLFAKAMSAEANSLKAVLDQYCAWSSQAINASKSFVHFSKNTLSSVIHNICGIFPFKRTMKSSKYLGLPLFHGKSKSIAFKDLLDKVFGKIEGW
jgi:hypothetical protein